MKKTCCLILGTFLSMFSTLIYAAPENIVQNAEISTENIQIHSSDTNEITIQNLENVIENKADLASFSNPIIEMPEINFVEDSIYDNRVCVFCWIFAIGLIVWLYYYGKNYKKYHTEGRHWFAKPLEVAGILFVVHAILHLTQASPIFLEYYWMIFFDILLFTYLFFHYYLKMGTQTSIKEKLKKA